MRQLVCIMFISKKSHILSFVVKRKFGKHRKVSNYYETDWLQIFLLIFMFLLRTNFVKNSHIKARIFFSFLKSMLNET